MISFLLIFTKTETFTNFVNINKMSIIKDCLYDFVIVPKLCRDFIDTPQFQRLRRVRQLGLVHYVYPSAVHTRFEHCLGVMHLAGLAVDFLQRNSNIVIGTRSRDLLMLAGLLHDIGHLAFSHLTDDHLIEMYGEDQSHEKRSVKLLKEINTDLNLLNSVEVEAVSNMILGIVPSGEPTWMYQLINNKECDVDVDKMDYLRRDAYHTGLTGFNPQYLISQMIIGTNGNLAFKPKVYTELATMFETRRKMFSQVYYHKTVAKLEEIYHTMIKKLPDAINQLVDDYTAEVYLREHNPELFRIIDSRDVHSKTCTVKTPTFAGTITDLDTVMARIPFE